MTLSWSTPTLYLLFHYAITSILALRSTPIAMVQAKQCGYQWRSTLILDSHDIHGGYKLWIGCFSMHCKRSTILNIPIFLLFVLPFGQALSDVLCILEKHSPDTGTSTRHEMVQIPRPSGTDCTGNNSNDGKPLANHLQILGIMALYVILKKNKLFMGIRRFSWRYFGKSWPIIIHIISVGCHGEMAWNSTPATRGDACIT